MYYVPYLFESIYRGYHNRTEQTAACGLPLRPSVALVALFPLVLHIAESHFYILDYALVAGILAHVVAQLDRRAAAGAGDLDDDVEGLRFLAFGLGREVVWLS